MQVKCHPAALSQRWQLDACPWWLRWAAQHGACLRRPPALKPAMLAKHATKRILALSACCEPEAAHLGTNARAADPSAPDTGPSASAEGSTPTLPTACAEHPLSRPPQRPGSSGSVV